MLYSLYELGDGVYADHVCSDQTAPRKRYSIFANSSTGHTVVVVVLLFYVHDKHLRSCRDGHLT